MAHSFLKSLKPENILIGADGYAKLTDFGLSKENVLGSHEAKSLCGTAEYLSPEVLISRQQQQQLDIDQCDGYGKASDWWSFGALIYEMLCGIPPFYSKDREQLYQNIKNCKPKLDYPYLSEPARDILEHLLVKDPTKRLGNTSGGVSAIKEHPWFDEINWDQINHKLVHPPYIP